MWTRRAATLALAGLSGALVMPALAARRAWTIVPFQTSPFPYDGTIPDTGKPFLDTRQGDERGHTSPRGGVYFEHPTYSDRSVLLAVAPHRRETRAALVVFLHGNLARLERDVIGRQRVVAQFLASHLDAALVAPQCAVDALDSSAGHFWDADGFGRFLDEAAAKLGAWTGQGAAAFAGPPVVLVAYSGGYNPAAAILSHAVPGGRIAGVVLLDALYGDEQAFADWIVRSNGGVFFFSAYSPSSAPSNQALRTALAARGIRFDEGLPDRVARGTIAFLPTAPVPHNDFVTRAWVPDPLRAVLSRLSIGGS